jgi:hypothetical protein
MFRYVLYTGLVPWMGAQEPKVLLDWLFDPNEPYWKSRVDRKTVERTLNFEGKVEVVLDCPNGDYTVYTLKYHRPNV